MENKTQFDRVMCNLSPHCALNTCPHKTPHIPMVGNQHPNCQDEDTYCYWQDRPVNCVEVK